MIDPKLNTLPVDPDDEIVAANEGKPAASTGDVKAKRRGLSINDTIASSASLSTGSRGVDTSGVRAGAGAGAGTTTLNAGQAGESPAPQVMGGDRGSGTTVLGSNNSATTGSTVPSDLDTSGDVSSATMDRGTSDPLTTGPLEMTSAENLFGGDDEIAALAYRSWCDRGCPEGSPEIDWHRAVEEHRRSRNRMTRSANN